MWNLAEVVGIEGMGDIGGAPEKKVVMNNTLDLSLFVRMVEREDKYLLLLFTWISVYCVYGLLSSQALISLILSRAFVKLPFVKISSLPANTRSKVYIPG